MKSNLPQFKPTHKRSWRRRCIIAIGFVLGFNAIVSAQAVNFKDDLLRVKTLSDSITNKKPIEKLYLQFDKPYYAIGDTIWFKAYLFNGAYFTASDKSGIVYVDITNDSSKIVKQYSIAARAGLGWGNIGLDEKEFNAGTYTIRAYTNWMRNFGDDYFFSKTFYVAGTGENSWLINRQATIATADGFNTANVKMQFSDINKMAAADKVLTLQVMAGNKHLYKQKLQTDQNGLLDVNFKLPEKASSLVIVAENEQKDKRAVIPIILNRPENIDIQFLPEGGSLVSGLPAHIGFKAVGEDGKGIDISGVITDHNQNKVAEFKSVHSGMGSFDLTIQAGESYIAKVTLPGGTIKEYPLPATKNTGMVLKIKNRMESDSVEVSVAATNDIIQTGESYFLIGKARGIVCYAAIFNFHEGNAIKKKIAKSLFPTGITHFTTMTTKYQPLNERLTFIDHHDNLNIQFKTGKPGYGPRDSVALKIKVTDNTGKPVQGNFSLAVTDDTQVKTDTANGENINARMLLTADLKGYVEEPGYYLTSKVTEAWQALDDLLLTQGWIGYDWQQVFNPPATAYEPEHDFAVKGNVINVFNKPVKGTNVLLFSKKPAMLMDTLTDNGGKFVFDHLPRVDTPIFILKAVNKNGKSFNVRIIADEIKLPDFTKSYGPLLEPWYVNSDTALLNYNKSNALIKQRENFPAGGHVLNEVKITAKKIIKGSQNLNGPGEADVVLDEKDLEAAGKKTLLQLLQENIKGFREGVFPSGSSWTAIEDMFLSKYVTDLNPSLKWYFIGGKPIKLIVDGVSVSKIISNPTLSVDASFFDMRDYLKSQSAEDIKGIEIINTAGYAGTYLSRFDPGDLITSAMYNTPPVSISASDIAFVEITTRSGHGPVIDNTPGMYLYKPLPISWPKQFYKPMYAVKDTANRAVDLRSTIDWEPGITTGINGEAKVFFYTADKPSTYTLIMEGADMNGNLGYKAGKISVGKPVDKSKPLRIEGK